MVRLPVEIGALRRPKPVDLAERRPTRQPRLLVVSDTLGPDPNGVALIALKTSELLSEQAAVLLFGPAGAVPPASITYTGVPRSRIGTADFRVPQLSLRELSLAVRHADKVVVHTLGPLGCAALVLARRHHKHSTLFLHNNFPRLMRHSLGFGLGQASAIAAARIERWAIARATRVIAPSSLGMDGCETLRLGPPLVTERSDSATTDHRPLVVAYHGRVSREKAVDATVRAIARADPGHTRFRFRIIGDGGQLAPTLRLAWELGVPVEHVPWCEDPLVALADVDIYVLASRTETYSMATLEAIGCGLPIVARRVGEIPGYIRDHETGLLFNNDSELPGLLNALADDPELRWRLASAALVTATHKSVWEQFADAAFSA
jgi:glycosyltransferase involved in cell wall biosynthesis